MKQNQAAPMLDLWILPFIHRRNTTCVCRLCGYTHKVLNNIKSHIFAVHLQYKPYKCKYCDFSAVEPNKTERHLMAVHPKSDPRIVRLRFKGNLPEIPKTIPEYVEMYDPSTGDSDADDSSIVVALPNAVDNEEDNKPVFGDSWKPGDPFPNHHSPEEEPLGDQITDESETAIFPNLILDSDDMPTIDSYAEGSQKTPDKRLQTSSQNEDSSTANSGSG